MENFQRKQVDANKLQETVRAKWSDGVLREGFVPFPKTLLRCFHRVFPGQDGAKELAVLLAFVDYKRPFVSRPPSIEYIAFTAGLSVPDVQTILDRLTERKLIEISEEPNGGLDADLDGFYQKIEELSEEEEAV